MADSLFEKARLIGLGNLHDLLDKVGELNTPAMARQRVRNLEDASERLDLAAADARAKVTVAQDERIAQLQEIETTNSNIDLFLSDNDRSNDSLAEWLGTRVIELQGTLEANRELLEAHQAEAHSMEALAAQIKAKLVEARGRLRQLEQMDGAAKANEEAARALHQARELTTVDAEQSLDSLDHKTRERLARSKERLGSATAALQSPVETAVMRSKAQAYIAQRRAALAAKKPAADPTPATT